MKTLETPRTNRIGNLVAYRSPFGQCCRAYCSPHNPQSEPQSRMRAIFGSASSGWGGKLTEAERQRWVVAAQTAPSHPWLGQYSPLSGQQLCTKINSTLGCVGQAPVDEPPGAVVFSPNPVGDLVIDYDAEGGLRLLLSVGPATEDIMLFGQAPCSAGRMKHRRVCYLGLLGPATNGQVDITALYTARLGGPSPGQKVFIVTCQQKNGWKGQDHVASAIVPAQPLAGEQQRNESGTVAAVPMAQAAPAEVNSSLSGAMYKGSTPDARGMHTGSARVHPLSTLCASLVHGWRVARAGLRVLGMVGAEV